MSGDGTLYRYKNNNKWYLIISHGWDPTLRNGKGGYKQQWIDLHTTDKNVAKENKKTILAELKIKGRYDPPSTDLFKNWLDFWLNELKKSNIRATTYDFYEYLIRIHIKPELGSYQLKDIGPEVLQKFYNQKRIEKKLSKKKDELGNYLPSDEFLSSRTIRGMQIVIDMALKKAVQLHKIPENPNAVLEKVKYKRPKVKYLTSAQVIDFLEGISNDRWYPAIVTDLGSGLRVGELVAIKWKEHIDLDRGIIRVEGAISEVNTYQEEGPKTVRQLQDPKSEKGKRIVPLPEDVIEVLRHWQIEQKKEKLKAGPLYNDQGYVFTWEDGRPVRSDYLSKHFLKLARAQGFEGITFHKLRHSYATMLLECGEEMKTIQENLGDSTLQIVSDTYTHVAEELKKRAAQKLTGFTKKRQIQ